MKANDVLRKGEVALRILVIKDDLCFCINYKRGTSLTKLAFRLQIFTFQFTNKHLVLQTCTSDYNSAF